MEAWYMDVLKVTCVDDIACEMTRHYDEIGKYEEPFVSAVCLHEDAVLLIEDLIHHGFDLGDVNIARAVLSGYDKEYYVTVYHGHVDCKPAYVGGKYLTHEADVMYVFEDCSSKVLDKVDAKKMYEVHFEDVFTEEELDCENCDDCPFKDVCEAVAVEESFPAGAPWEEFLDDLNLCECSCDNEFEITRGYADGGYLSYSQKIGCNGVDVEFVDRLIDKLK